METARTFGERLRATYIARGFNRSTFQQAMGGTAYTTILAWERDKSTPSPENLQKASDVLGVPSSVLRGEHEPMTEADYAEWGAFLETTEGGGMSDAERATLGSMRFDPADPPTLDRYRALLLALRMTRRP